MFYSKNVPPDRIIIPMYMFASTRYGQIPIQFVPEGGPAAVDIIEDGKDIPEVSPEQSDDIAAKDEEIKKLRAQVAAMSVGSVAVPNAKTVSAAENNTSVPPVSISANMHSKILADPKAEAKIPSGPIIQPGEGSVDLAPRLPGDDRMIRQAMMPDKELDESNQKDVVVEIVDGKKAVKG